jgi:hypothetical protein
MKKSLATLMAVCMVIGITACGQEPASSSSSIGTQESTTVDVSESYVESVGGSEESENITDGYGRIYDEELGVYVYPSTKSESEENASTPENDRVGTSPIEDANVNTEWVSGLIMCAHWGFGNGEDYVIFSLNPSTCEYEEIQQFSFRQKDLEYYYEWPPIIYHKNQSDRFSNDLSKLAETYVVYGTKESHAGWVNTDGTFFDVPEALGMGAENEFVEQPNYYSIGFTEESNYFVFAELTEHKGPVSESDLEKDGKFYYVSLDNLSEVYEGNPLKEEATRGYEVFNLTQWINDEEYLSDYCNNNGVICRVTDNNHYTTEEYVPGEARTNLSAITGPDGSIAFVSKPKNSREDVDIYITQRDGSGLKRVFTCDEIFGYGGRRKGNFISLYLLSWE